MIRPTLWRPRSILQLVLLGLFIVIAPLCVAILYTLETLDDLSLKNSRINHTVVALTRSSQTLDSDLLGLERRARQFAALGNEDLLTLFQREHEQLQQVLSDLVRLLNQGEGVENAQVVQAQQAVSRTLKDIPLDGSNLKESLALFNQLSEQNIDLQRASSQYVDRQISEHSRYTDEIKESLMLMVTILAVLTFGFALLFIYWINTPIKEIETEIRQLASGDLSRSITISGPLEMRTLGHQLEWLRSCLNEFEQEKQKFLRHISHELKTPLSSLREGADLLADGVVGDLQTRQREIVTIIQDNSHELQRLIENLLDYNQVMNSQQLQVQSLEIRPLIEELLEAHKIIIERKSLTICLSGQASTWCADVAKLKTCLDNLLSNAVSYTPRNGQIDIAWRNDDKILYVEVANSGTTIPEEDKNRIFKPFYQGQISRSGPIKGSGIGLSVARECIQAQGGTLELVEHKTLPVCFKLQCPQLSGQGVAA